MKKLFISALLALAPAVFAQDNKPDLDSLPALPAGEAAAEDPAGPVQRPDSGRLISEISASLRLSSKQEDRIAAAVDKKASEFDKVLREYEKSAAEEKKWRYKMNDARHALEKIQRNLPDTVREFLDDEQRQEYDEMLAARNKPEPKKEVPGVEEAQPAAEGAAKPLKKKRRLKKKAPAAVRGTPNAAAPAADAGLGADDEAGQVMVDKDPTAGSQSQPQPKKRRLKRKAPTAQPRPPAQVNEPAGAKPTGQEAAADEEAGSYP